MQQFGIIGYPLGHSQSAVYFNNKFLREGINAHYDMFPIVSIEAFPALLSEHVFAGMNVTIPYKQAVIPYLDELDETAREIGAVNVIRFVYQADGTCCRIGYNTDALGFMDSLRPMLCPEDRKALVLGTGGAAKACYYGLRKLGLLPVYVSRNVREGMLTYDQVDLSQYTIVVNATPLGMWPELDTCPPIPYEQLTERHLLFDCVYNPEETLFLKRGKEHTSRLMNGKGMLLGQAIAAWQIWNS